MNAVQGRSIEMVTLLLDRGADPNAADNRGFTALHRAAELGDLRIAELLLNRGAYPQAEAEGHTPQSLAQLRNHSAITKLLSGR
jgi:ankyrin repeat protein